MNYDKNYFIKKFMSIPDKNWMQHDLYPTKKSDHAHYFEKVDGPNCALGHLGVTYSNDIRNLNTKAPVEGYVGSEESIELIKLLNGGELRDDIGHIPYYLIYNINDAGAGVGACGKTPKQRMINALLSLP